MEENSILGININGISTQIKTLDFDSPQSAFECICNISLIYDDNGNGKYSIQFYDRNLTPGCPIVKWRIDSGYIEYDWGKSKCYFYLIDAYGHSTDKIFALKQKGAYSGFDVITLTKAIFPKAINIITKYPSAEVYNLCHETQVLLTATEVTAFKEKLDTQEYLDYLFNKSLPKISQIITNYKQLDLLLNKDYGERNRILLNELRSKIYIFCKNSLGLK